LFTIPTVKRMFMNLFTLETAQGMNKKRDRHWL
jgi:hypothetical protein